MDILIKCRYALHDVADIWPLDSLDGVALLASSSECQVKGVNAVRAISLI